MSMDMIGMTLRSLGFDVEAMQKLVLGIGQAFEQQGVRLEGIEARLTQIEGSLTAILTQMGLYVPPSLELMKQIEAESQAIVERQAKPDGSGGQPS